MLYNVQTPMHSRRNQTPQKQNSATPPLINTELALLQDKEHSQPPKNQEIKFFRFVGDKAKKIKRKPDSIMEKLRIEAPFSFQHVSNFLNMLSINQRAVKDKTFEESYFRSIFYFKSIEKVQIRKNALILYLKHPNNFQCQSEKDKIQYLIERYKSFGDNQFYQLALQLEQCYKKYSSTNFNAKLSSCYESQPLSRFIQLMHDKIYGCKVSPNKLIISRALLQLLGEDMQTFALGLCKYKTPMQEIISTEQYVPVISKSIESIGLLCDFLQQTIDLQTLQEKSYLQFYDYLCSKRDKKIYCKIKLYMPTPLMNCLEAIEVKNELHSNHMEYHADQKKRKLIEQMQEIRFRQNESLKCLIPIQENMLRENKGKVPGYIQSKRH